MKFILYMFNLHLIHLVFSALIFIHCFNFYYTNFSKQNLVSCSVTLQRTLLSVSGFRNVSFHSLYFCSSKRLCFYLLTPAQSPTQWPRSRPHHTPWSWSICLWECWCCRPPRWSSPCATPAPWRKTVLATWPPLPWFQQRCLRSSSAPCSSSGRTVSRKVVNSSISFKCFLCF